MHAKKTLVVKKYLNCFSKVILLILNIVIYDHFFPITVRADQCAGGLF